MATTGSLPLFQTLFVFLLSLSAWAEMNVRKCFKGTEQEPIGEAALSCPAGSVISINEALLGKNQWFECVLTEDDCMHSTGIFRNCEGLNYCEKSFRTLSARCGYISILLIRYDCIPVAIPTVPVIISTTSSYDVRVEGQLSVGVRENDHTTGSGHRRKEKSLYSKTDSDDEDKTEVGLLIVTICGSLITGVMLVIAIVMTIRRILNYPTWLQRRNRNSSSRWDSCIERACFQVDKFPCFSGLDSSESSPAQTLSSQTKQTRVPLSADDTVPNIQRTRMTPIGQEASDGDVIAHPKDKVNKNNDPEVSDISEHAQIPGTVGDQVSRPFKFEQQNRASFSSRNETELQHCNSNDISMEVFAATQFETVTETEILNKQSRQKNVRSVCKKGKLGEKDLCHTRGMYIHKRCNKKHVDCDEIQKKNMALDGREQNVHTLNNYNYKNNNSLNDKAKKTNNSKNINNYKNNNNDDNNNKNKNSNSEASDCLTMKSKYSAIVVPNTETSSRC